MRPSFILCCLLACQLSKAQSELPPFGQYSQAEREMKECSFDKNAEAVILLDEAVSDHDDDYRLLTHRRTRIKILNQRGVDRGNISIRFYSKDKFEFIRNVRATSYIEEKGYPLIQSVDNKSIFTEKIDQLISQVKFAIPNVKPGTIIEYEYDSYMEHYGGLSAWEFQHDIPVIRSCYLLTLLPNTEFQYLVQKKDNYDITIKPMNEVGKVYFEMNNLPGLKFEPYMDAVNDYLQKVEFQLAGFINRATGGRQKVNHTWKALGYDLVSDKSFGGVIKKGLSGMDDIKNLVSKETTNTRKLAVIYNYVRTNFEWNGYHSKYAESLKNVWEKKTGHAGEINLLLINLLQTFDIEVYPLLIAERQYGKIDTSYPFLDRFNKVAAYAIADGKTYILDATQKFVPPGLIPYPLLNTVAFLVDKKNFRLIRITSTGDAYQNTMTINGKLDEKGVLKGDAQIMSLGYARQFRVEQAKRDRAKFISRLQEEEGEGLVIDDCQLEQIDNDDQPLIQNIEFHNELNVSGGFVFLNCNLFTGMVKNPFTATERFTNINFGYPYIISLQAQIQLPEKYKTDKLPLDKTVTTPDKAFSLSRRLKLEGNILKAEIKFVQTATLVPYDEYDFLKSYYKQIIELLNEPVVIKLGS